MKTFAMAAAALLAASWIGSAQGTTTARDVQHQAVSYADLNVQSEADAAILLKRIKAAARTVCGLRRGNPMPAEIVARLELCAEDATARAIADIDTPLLTFRREIVVQNTGN
jgi:UrcA family protein